MLGPPPATLPGDEMPPPFVNVQPTYITPPVWRWQGPYVGVNGGLRLGLLVAPKSALVGAGLYPGATAGLI